MSSPLLLLPALALLLVGLPLAGAWLDGQPLAPYLQFPPTTRAAQHASFTWPAFAVVAALVAAAVAPFLYRLLRPAGRTATPPARRPMPWWGWAGLALLAVSWLLAWTRFESMAPLQRHTFTPLWLGYVVLVNALTWRRTGHCLLRDRPLRLLALFPLSAVFWWFFEFLNRFVQNWYYVGGEALGPWQYFWQATLPFSTVLPAVLSTRDLLASYPRLYAGLGDAWRIRPAAPRALALAALLAGGTALACIGVWPRLLYPLVWVAPLILLLALEALVGRPTILAPIARGDWREPWLAALAALVCGLFWELWNAGSLARWEYAIPHVHRFEVFAMPLLGFAGYLPFGLQCLAAARLLGPDHPLPGAVLSRAPASGSSSSGDR